MSKMFFWQQSAAVLGASLILLLLTCVPEMAGGEPPRNVALRARASAFEAYQGMTADLANDGKTETRWSGIPGHNTGGWFELDWERPVRVAELVIVQHDRYVSEIDVQVWNDATRAWVTLQRLGRKGLKLARVVVCRFPRSTTRRLRLANITGGPSFTEVQVFEEPRPHPPAVNIASDANGNFIGMVSDEWGNEPVAGVDITLSGQCVRGTWQAAATSDEHGLFFVPMPLGLAGHVAVTARLPRPENSAEGAVRLEGPDAADLQYGLTPANLRREDTILGGAWRFAPDPPADFWKPEFDSSRWATVRVPGHFEMEGFRSAEGVGGYSKRFRAPGGAGRLKLRFDGVYSGAEVWVNGQPVARHEGGATPFEADITDAVRKGENLLAVRVTQHTAVSDRLDKMSEYADFPLAGIMRPVHMFRVPAAHIGALEIATTFDGAYRDAVIAGRLAVLNESPEPLANAAVDIRLLDPEGRPVAADSKKLAGPAPAWERVDVDFSMPVSSPKQWEAEHPNRYTLEFELRRDGRVADRLAQRVGFRQTEIRGGRLLINGRPVKIRGTCHHDSDPLRGRAVTTELVRQDLELMKEANLNALRTSHYPPLAELLDVADELGIYVEDEGPFCWADAADDLRLTPRIMQLNAEMVARDRNHPSVFIWSVCNESAFGYGFERSHEWLRRADPSRPNAGSYDRGSLEVLARHNPITVADIAEMEKVGKPVLWDESWCIFQGIWGDVAEMWVDPGIRDYYAEPLPAIYDRMMRSQNILGTQIWAWSDDIFCLPGRGLEYGRQTTLSHFIENQYRLPGRGLSGDAPWGVVDGWRRKKPEFWITKKLHSPVKIVDAPVPVPAAGQSIRVAVENQFDFTDLSELVASWRIGSEKGTARLSVPPQSSGELEIRPEAQPIAGDVLEIVFVDGQDRQVDAYQLPFGEHRDRRPELSGPAAAPLRILQENLLAGTGTRIVGRDFELAFDRTSGGLRRGVAFGQALLLELPRLHLLPAARAMSPLPDPLSWRLRALDIKPDGRDIRVRIEGSYDRFEGVYDVLVTPAGEMTVRASFKYSGEKILAREIGLAFSVPRDCDLLRWERRAEWSVYPSDHIGRPLGEARAFAVHSEVVPPAWPWSEDNSPMGSNDFRSTKRHVYWASISYPDGPGVWVKSDGSQHVRAMVESDRISFHVNDWYGGTHTGLLEWTSNYGEGTPVMPGQTLESTARLRMARVQTQAGKVSR